MTPTSLPSISTTTLRPPGLSVSALTTQTLAPVLSLATVPDLKAGTAGFAVSLALAGLAAGGAADLAFSQDAIPVAGQNYQGLKHLSAIPFADENRPPGGRLRGTVPPDGLSSRPGTGKTPAASAGDRSVGGVGGVAGGMGGWSGSGGRLGSFPSGASSDVGRRVVRH